MGPSGEPGPDVNLSPQFLIPCGILAIIVLFLCSARTYSRCRPSIHLRLDDYLIIIAAILSLGEYVAAAISACYGWGRLSYYIPPAKLAIALKAQFAVQALWLQTITLVRLSIACSLLPLSQNKTWRATLYFLITGQIFFYLAWMILLFVSCRPLRSWWEPTIKATCWPYNPVMNFSWATASFFIAMDLLMALSPITLIKTLNRPLREKVLVAGLMALGLLTTAAAGAKMSTFPGIYKGDVLQGQMLASLLAKLEEQIGIICACLPTLKGPAERLLIRLGVLSHELRFSRPSFVMSARRQATPTLTSRTLESSNVDSDYNSNVTTLWLDSQNSKSTKGDSGFDSLSQSSSKQSLAQGTKAPVVRVEEV